MTTDEILNCITKNQELFEKVIRYLPEIERLVERIEELSPKLNNSMSVEEQIKEIIKQLGISCHLKGYGYLQKAILLMHEKEDIYKEDALGLYDLIAQEYQISRGKVQRDINTAVRIAWQNREESELLKKIFPVPEKERPKSKRFIMCIVEFYRSNL